jgi:hypothetical protein
LFVCFFEKRAGVAGVALPLPFFAAIIMEQGSSIAGDAVEVDLRGNLAAAHRALDELYLQVEEHETADTTGKFKIQIDLAGCRVAFRLVSISYPTRLYHILFHLRATRSSLRGNAGCISWALGCTRLHRSSAQGVV